MNILLKGALGIVAGFVIAGCTCRAKPTEEPRGMMKPSTAVREGGPVMDNVYFAFDKSNLSEASKATLRRSADWLKTHPDFKVKIEGHADERGTSKYNLALGKRRAVAAAKYLQSLGVESHRISTVSFGESRPIDPAHNEAAWSKNRRDEFSSIGADRFIVE